ncbi:hypothetical protein MQH10_08890 [Phenylobacterium aquaticum]|nr:hypothetical protein [Phenylobacterium aquaticum]MCI3132451.1 hypothetical protein [Phenylobacterium aquaticum]
MAICGPSNWLWSSRVPIFRITMAGFCGTRLVIGVPQVPQNSRVTGWSRSVRVNRAGSPFTYLNPSAPSTMNRFGPPPEMYWHSRQRHWPRIMAGPCAS